MEQLSSRNPNQSPQGMGYLIVRTSTAGGAIPVEGVTVSVRNQAEPGIDSLAGSIRHTLRTDRDGNTPRLPLPAPERSLAYTPGNTPYTFYDIDVSSPGYYPQQFIRVPIYDTITSIQNAYLIPLPEGSIHSARDPLDAPVDEGVNPML